MRGGREGGGDGHGREGGVGDVVKEGAEAEVADFVPEEDEGKEADGVGDAGHDGNVEPDAVSHGGPLCL